MCCLFGCPFIVEFVVVVKLNMYVFQAMLHSRTSDALRGSVVECHFLDFSLMTSALVNPMTSAINGVRMTSAENVMVFTTSDVRGCQVFLRIVFLSVTFLFLRIVDIVNKHVIFNFTLLIHFLYLYFIFSSIQFVFLCHRSAASLLIVVILVSVVVGCRCRWLLAPYQRLAHMR